MGSPTLLTPSMVFGVEGFLLVMDTHVITGNTNEMQHGQNAHGFCVHLVCKNLLQMIMKDFH